MKNGFQKAKYVKILLLILINVAKLTMERPSHDFQKFPFLKSNASNEYMSTFAMGSECRTIEVVEVNLFQF